MKMAKLFLSALALLLAVSPWATTKIGNLRPYDQEGLKRI